MIRQFALPAAVVVALSCSTVVAAAEPVASDEDAFAIGMCYDPALPLPQRPAVFDYNCDNTGVLQDME